MRPPVLSAALLSVAAIAIPACQSRPPAALARSAPVAELPASVAEQWRGKVVVADFWATWCRPCLASSPNVQALHDRFAADPAVLVVGVHTDDSVEDPGAYLAQNGYTYPLVAKGREVANAFGVHALPTFVVLDQEGREVLRHVGLMTERAREEIASTVASLRARG